MSHKFHFKRGITYVVIKTRRPMQVDPRVIRPLHLGQLRTILDIARPVKDIVIRIDQPDAGLPVPDPPRPLRVRVVPRVRG